jgi:hypothetical protein
VLWYTLSIAYNMHTAKVCSILSNSDTMHHRFLRDKLNSVLTQYSRHLIAMLAGHVYATTTVDASYFSASHWATVHAALLAVWSKECAKASHATR